MEVVKKRAKAKPVSETADLVHNKFGRGRLVRASEKTYVLFREFNFNCAVM